MSAQVQRKPHADLHLCCISIVPYEVVNIVHRDKYNYIKYIITLALSIWHNIRLVWHQVQR